MKWLKKLWQRKRIYKDLCDLLMEPDIDGDSLGDHKKDRELQTTLRFGILYPTDELICHAEYAMLTNRFRAAMYLNLIITQRQYAKINRHLETIKNKIE